MAFLERRVRVRVRARGTYLPQGMRRAAAPLRSLSMISDQRERQKRLPTDRQPGGHARYCRLQLMLNVEA